MLWTEIEQYINDIKSGGSLKDKATKKLYLYLKGSGCEKIIYSQINYRNTNVEDAQDLFHEAFIILMEKLEQGEHQEQFSIRNYLLGIAKNLWKNKLISKQREHITDDFSAFEDWESVSCEGDFLADEKKSLVNGILETIDEKCKKILLLWMNSYKMEEIATRLELSSEKIARKYRYRCHKKLMQQLKNQPALMQELSN
ncbi:MAG: sigma-70 family RNA polymerase sigma factor [Saprospirales bacterium]|nr:MAG: sigma-70 family RNA polymerase sigma factor [Saprospirales bacterium]